ncbi:hypothetical protein EVAR_89257_1 [Eumeta japonica]|uniref:Uncharacterized protein n=1 Tax=Eumeta variegata TaxID=151549 RepID=A0A4C1VMP4_EUMVA|nr:hypothetical protein EVAR_89257_1 [Eumeta japonica]
MSRLQKLRATDRTLHRTRHRLAIAFFVRRFDTRVRLLTAASAGLKSLVAETQLDSEKKLKSKRGRLLECIQGNLQVLDKFNP